MQKSDKTPENLLYNGDIKYYDSLKHLKYLAKFMVIFKITVHQAENIWHSFPWTRHNIQQITFQMKARLEVKHYNLSHRLFT